MNENSVQVLCLRCHYTWLLVLETGLAHSSWADAPWTHIEVGYNFQLWQMLNALCPGFETAPERLQYLDRRASAEAREKDHAPSPPRTVKIVHFSGELKPWHRHLCSQYRHLRGHQGDVDFTHTLLEEQESYKLYIAR